MGPGCRWHLLHRKTRGGRIMAQRASFLPLRGRGRRLSAVLSLVVTVAGGGGLGVLRAGKRGSGPHPPPPAGSPPPAAPRGRGVAVVARTPAGGRPPRPG